MMRQLISGVSWLLPVAAVCCFAAQVQGAMGVANLRAEYRVNPLGLDSPQPRLSWIVTAEERGQKQSAYQILVAGDEKLLAPGQADLWDSGEVKSDQSNQVAYQGKPLASLTRCVWKVRVWDQAGKPSEWSTVASWTMGLLKPTDWKAKWIGYDAPPSPGEITLNGCKWIWFPEGNAREKAPAGKAYFRQKFTLPADRRRPGSASDRDAGSPAVVFPNTQRGVISRPAF